MTSVGWRCHNEMFRGDWENELNCIIRLINDYFWDVIFAFPGSLFKKN